MANYKGSWLKGFASTFDPLGGLSWGLQWKEKKKAQKKIDDAIEQLKINSMELATKFDKARADGTITQQEYGDAMSWAIPLGKEFIGRVNDLYTNYQDMTPDQLQIELDNIDAMFKFSKELDFTNLEQMKEFGSKLTQPDAKMQWNLVIKSIEGREKPEEPEVYKTVTEFQAKYGTETPYTFNVTAGGYIPKFKEPETKEPDLTGAINYLKKFPNPTPEQFNSLRTGAEKYFNVDLADVTQESLEKITPEGEISAGEKRTWDMASLVLFGSSDWVTGISKPGIISVMISNKLNMGQPLTDEEKSEVRNNYNMIKGTLPAEIINNVESQLKRYGIPLEEPTVEPTPEITPEPEPKKWWEFWKGETKQTIPPAPEKPEKHIIKSVTSEEIPTPKVPTESKEALIPLMTKKELEDAIKGLDPSDPMYKLLYDEAVKRGYITK